MKLFRVISSLLLLLLLSTVSADEKAYSNYHQLTMLQGDWKLAPAELQEGGATKKGPALKLIGTDKTAMRFQVIGKGSTLQENLLPGTGKEMATMYHCDDFNNCSQIYAKHYCAKQNQPELILNADKTMGNIIKLDCDMGTQLCQSDADHVHNITHELSADSTHLKTIYTVFKGGKFKNNSTYHFVKK